MLNNLDLILVVFIQVLSLCLATLRGVKPISGAAKDVVSFMVDKDSTVNTCANPKCPNYIPGVIGS